MKTISLYRQPVKSEGLFTEKKIIRRAREKLQRLSLTVYIPDNTYFAHRLTSGYVINNLFEKGELKESRKRAGDYLVDIHHLESIYQYREAEEHDKAFNIAHSVQDLLV